ncbi:hypothetical protein ACJX0J_015539, partial [Zea mays]
VIKYLHVLDIYDSYFVPFLLNEVSVSLFLFTFKCHFSKEKEKQKEHTIDSFFGAYKEEASNATEVKVLYKEKLRRQTWGHGLLQLIHLGTNEWYTVRAREKEKVQMQPIKDLIIGDEDEENTSRLEDVWMQKGDEVRVEDWNEDDDMFIILVALFNIIGYMLSLLGDIFKFFTIQKMGLKIPKPDSEWNIDEEGMMKLSLYKRERTENLDCRMIGGLARANWMSPFVSGRGLSNSSKPNHFVSCNLLKRIQNKKYIMKYVVLQAMFYPIVS